MTINYLSGFKVGDKVRISDSDLPPGEVAEIVTSTHDGKLREPRLRISIPGRGDRFICHPEQVEAV